MRRPRPGRRTQRLPAYSARSRLHRPRVCGVEFRLHRSQNSRADASCHRVTRPRRHVSHRCDAWLRHKPTCCARGAALAGRLRRVALEPAVSLGPGRPLAVAALRPPGLAERQTFRASGAGRGGALRARPPASPGRRATCSLRSQARGPCRTSCATSRARSAVAGRDPGRSGFVRLRSQNLRSKPGGGRVANNASGPPRRGLRPPHPAIRAWARVSLAAPPPPHRCAGRPGADAARDARPGRARPHACAWVPVRGLCHVSSARANQCAKFLCNGRL
jgi:hypothetical protein